MMRILLVAGEASGDAHAGPVAARLHGAGAEVVAVGGPAVSAAGAEIVCGIDELAVLGFVEVARRLPRFLDLARRLEQRLREKPFDLFLSVDYPGFNLRFAARARRLGVPVLHYIGPQVWAWRAGRLETLRRVATHVALVLPFEKPLYDRAGIAATYVGHPLLDHPSMPCEPDRDVGIFPGSRPQELSRHLPVLLDAVAELRHRRPTTSLLVSRAPTVDPTRFAATLAAHGFDATADSTDAPARVAMPRCRALLVASGTATLEAALAERPFAVLYRTGRLNWEVARRLVQLPYVALANLVAGEMVVREYLQSRATPGALAAEAERLLDDEPERRRIQGKLRDVRSRLGPPGAAERVARLALDIAARRGAAR
jgi:lipid-A-disaccharide synthase